MINPRWAIRNRHGAGSRIRQGAVARCQGDSAKARTAFAAARKEAEKTVERQPDFAAALSLLGMIYAGLERKEEAISRGTSRL